MWYLDQKWQGPCWLQAFAGFQDMIQAEYHVYGESREINFWAQTGLLPSGTNNPNPGLCRANSTTLLNMSTLPTLPTRWPFRPRQPCQPCRPSQPCRPTLADPLLTLSTLPTPPTLSILSTLSCWPRQRYRPCQPFQPCQLSWNRVLHATVYSEVALFHT